MSLYIGNLSARTRKDELERVFRRFGECDLRLKDGYGFVVYGFAPQAEKAMKLLQGRAICGQQLTITWSNKQPKPRPVGRAHRPFEPRRRDFPARFRPGIKLPENGTDDVVAVDDGGGEEGDEEPGGRWGERAENEDSSNDDDGVGGGEAVMTDRYDPYRGYNRRDKDGDRWTEENSGEREQDVAHGSMFRINCFGCGEFGHKMRDCPAKREKFKRFDNNNNNNIPYRLERYPRHRNDRATPKYENAPEIDATDEDERVEKRSEKKKKKKRESKFSKRLIGSESAASASRSGSKPLKRRPRSRSRSRSVTRPRSSSSSASRSVSKSRYSSPSPRPLDPSGAEVPEPSDRTTREGVSVSVEEMCVALRHFGAEIPGEMEKEKVKHGSLESWFGSARLWPWEGIYYRRVKKGPISVENYERRVAQNREFGIVDRFVRSSSGWGEISQKNP